MLVPAYTKIFINSLSRSHMILLFQEDKRFKMYEEPFSQQPFSFMLVTPDYKINEISSNFKDITGIGLAEIDKLQQDSSMAATLDDIVKIKNFDCFPSKLLFEYETNEAEIKFIKVKQNWGGEIEENS